MKVLKVFSIIFLAIFVITLPVASFVSNLGMRVLNEDGLEGLMMETVLSNEALPQRIREIIWFQSWYSEAGVDAAPRMLLTGVRNEQYADLLEIVVPTATRESLLDSLVGGIFGWLESDEVYPNLVIEISSIFDNIQENTPAIATWAVETLKVPPCSPDQLASLSAGENAANLMGLISCKPNAEYKETVINQLAPLLGGALSQAPLPERMDISAQLQSSMDEEATLAAKGQLNRVRKLTPLLWVIPILVLGIALALVARSWDELLVWARWPLFVAGLLGTLLASRVANPLPLLEARLMPPPAELPAPVAPILLAVMENLLNTVGSALLWQMVIVLVFGLALLVYTYREIIQKLMSILWAWLKQWFEIRQVEIIESE